MKSVLLKGTVFALCLVVVLTMTVPAFAETVAENGEFDLSEYLLDDEGYMTYRRAEANPLTDAMVLDEALLNPEKDEELTYAFEVAEDTSFEIAFSYTPGVNHRTSDRVSVLIDGELPFTEAENLELPRIFADAEAMRTDKKGNDLIPEQKELFDEIDIRLRDDNLFISENLRFTVAAGQHTITLRNEGETIGIRNLSLMPFEVLPTAEESAAFSAGLDEVPDVLIKQQAEVTLNKSAQSIYPQYDRTTPATEPYDVSKIRRNVLGKNSWAKRGDAVSWKIEDVPADGLYYITLKYRQNEKNGGISYRKVEVNGVLTDAALANVAFPYNVSWQRQTLSDKAGEAIAVPLKKGDNIITLTAVLGEQEVAYQQVEQTIDLLSDLYIQMVMICGSNPDPYRDYHLETEIPNLLDEMTLARELILSSSASFDQSGKERTAETAPLDRAASQLADMLKNPDTIPTRISNFRDTVSALSSWLYSAGEQPLTLDYLLIHSADAELPEPNAGFFASLWHQVRSFVASFYEDYNTMSEGEGGSRTISVWANTGRDQIQQMYDMIRDDFTPENDISVHLSLVQSGFIEATLAGAGPDIALGVARGQPVNLACRGVLTDLTGFEDFDEVANRFAKTSCMPYTFNNGVYALPNTQSYFMMFYRKDVLEDLGIAVPQTWDEVQATISRLQKKNMTFGLPYTVISAAAAVDLGMGAKDMFSVLLLQNGGNFYAHDGKIADLDTEVAKNAFTTWCNFYTKYGFDLIYDFYTRFRYGEMPIGIASFEMYSTLTAAAPEIRGLWEMAPIPGTMQEDGTINRACGGAGSGIILFNKAKDADACWTFMKWWTEEETQTNYGTQVENILGPAGRLSTANQNAFQNLAWSDEELAVLNEQRSNICEIEEIPGSYFVSRCIDNAFRGVIYDDETPLEIFANEVDNINREITRKRLELKLPIYEEKEE